jgi:DNA polymerase-4
MVDSAINWLFVDLNSYFASIEQELCPEPSTPRLVPT